MNHQLNPNHRSFNPSSKRHRQQCSTRCDDYDMDKWVIRRKQRRHYGLLYLLGILYSCFVPSSDDMLSAVVAFTTVKMCRNSPAVVRLSSYIAQYQHTTGSSRIPSRRRRRRNISYKRNRDGSGEESELQPERLLLVPTGSGPDQSENDDNTSITLLISVIRQCTSTSHLNDIVKLEHQQSPPRCQVVVELTERFSHLLVIYNKKSGVRNNTNIEPNALDTSDETDEGNVLRILLELIVSTFLRKLNDSTFITDSTNQRSHEHEHMVHTVNCFVALRNVLHNAIMRNPSESSHHFEELMVPVINQLWNQIVDYEQHTCTSTSETTNQSVVQNMTSKRLVSFLLTIHKCRQYTIANGSGGDTNSLLRRIFNMNPTSLVYRRVCTRLCHGDRIDKMNITDIYHVFKSVDTTSVMSLSPSWHVCNNLVLQQLVISFVRRLRKPTFNNNISDIPMIIQSLEQMQRFWYSTRNCTNNMQRVIYSNTLTIQQNKNVLLRADEKRVGISILSKVTKEIELSIYRLLNTVINVIAEENKVCDANSTVNMQQLTIKELGTLAVAIRTVLPQRKPDMLEQNLHPLEMNFQELISEQLSMLQDPISSIAIHSATTTTIRDIARILRSWEYFQGHVVFNQQTTSNITAPNHFGHKMIQTLGHLTEQIVHKGIDSTFDTINPKDINNILRTVAFVPKTYATQSYFSALRSLLTHNDAFVRKCSFTELSNFCWFMAYKSDQYFYDSGISDMAIVALGNRIVEPDIHHSCTPKEACRILSSFTALCCDAKSTASSDIEICGDVTASSQTQQRHGKLLSTMFQCLGEYLLEPSTLSPYDVSSAIHAYAKAYYIYDMGIFDHLVDVFAEQVQINSSCSTLRQVCHTLWACGKMISIESSINDVDYDTIYPPVAVKPPYYTSFINMVSHVTQRADELAVQDVTQTLWAMASFNLFVGDGVTVGNKFVVVNVEPLLTQTFAVVARFNSQERATLLWSFTKMPSLSPLSARIIFLLTRPFAQMPANQCAAFGRPQEVSIILYALGRMNIRDVDVFRHLTNYVLEYHIHTASAQTIANILWAHRTVHIEPPQQLLESWTMSKLPDLKIAKSSEGKEHLYSE